MLKPDESWESLLKRAAAKLGFSERSVVAVDPEEGHAATDQHEENTGLACACGRYHQDALELPPLRMSLRASFHVHALPDVDNESVSCGSKPRSELRGMDVPEPGIRRRKGQYERSADRSHTQHAERQGEELPAQPARDGPRRDQKDELEHQELLSRQPRQHRHRESPNELRDRCSQLWAALDAAGVYVPPVEEDAADPKDRFHLERHGHGRGNTKSTKKRRSRESQLLLGRLLDHLEGLAERHGVKMDAPRRAPSSERELESALPVRRGLATMEQL